MKYLLYVFGLSLLVINQTYANESLSLKKMGQNEFKQLCPKVEEKIMSDIANEFHTDYDETQSFLIVRNNVTLFKLLPVTYASKKAINAICKLFVFSDKNNLIKILPLHYVQGDGDEVVGSCLGVQAVAIEHSEKMDYLIYLLVYRFGNQYGDAVCIASIDSGKINKDEALTNCVSNNKDISTIAKIRKALKNCLSKTTKSINK
jgi:hypothetical protein